MKYINIRRILTSVTLVIAALSLASAQENILGIENGAATTVGIYIKDLRTGKVIVDHNASLAMTPASVTKAYTTASALLTIGPEYRFKTIVGLSGQRSATTKSRWEGDLVIQAGGDPTFGSSEFKSTKNVSDSIVAAVKRMGITEITGAVTIVESFKDAGALPTWECEDIAWPYGAGLFGFNYRGNYVRAYPNKGTTTPASDLQIKVINTDGTRVDQLRGINSVNLTVWVPKANRSKKDWSINTTNPNPAATYVVLLAERLRGAGVKVGSKRVSNGTPALSTTVYTQYSPEARYICRNLMKRSDNLFAEGILRALDADGDRDDCLKAERDLWKGIGLPVAQTIVNDGSGLTRANRFSPRFLGQMLEHMTSTPVADIYIDCFPIAGIDGTMKGFGAKTSLKGRLAMKTGSISSVQCYAGYRLSTEGKPTHVVVVMVNGFFCSRSELKGKVEKFLLNTFK
ncbi:MAG: D-alanyl-D-alanine carboxypeptidase/D-alanyl-D-alanine-endopeptidase [Odoribacter sp.]|nr:D-alanyl-D-alanine carboxypeptidase/D-alanyl-D-alanine-endopeptidase [Odoribacter sp.]